MAVNRWRRISPLLQLALVLLCMHAAVLLVSARAPLLRLNHAGIQFVESEQEFASIQYAADTSSLSYNAASSGAHRFMSDGVEAVSIGSDAAGSARVGINQPSPMHDLDVNGTARVTSLILNGTDTQATLASLQATIDDLQSTISTLQAQNSCLERCQSFLGVACSGESLCVPPLCPSGSQDFVWKASSLTGLGQDAILSTWSSSGCTTPYVFTMSSAVIHSSVALFNNKPAVRFDGSSTMTNNDLPIGQTVFVVMSQDACTCSLSCGQTSHYVVDLGYRDAGTRMYQYGTTGDPCESNAVATLFSNGSPLSCTICGTGDGQARILTYVRSAGPAKGAAIMSRYTLDEKNVGYVAEYRQYERVMNTAERQAVECELAAEYGITVAHSC